MSQPRDLGSRIIRAPHDVAELGLPLLGTLPNIGKTLDIRQELGLPNSRIGDSASAITAALGLLNDDGAPKVVAVTSNDAGDGKSTASFALAATLAPSWHPDLAARSRSARSQRSADCRPALRNG